MQDTNSSEPERLHALVEGRVQGVGFRMFVQETAVKLGVRGWVRNLWEGKVEVVAEGDRPRLDALLKALNAGPRAAVVNNVTTEWFPATGEFHHFSMRASG